ncbi:hypothetical protein [Dyella sp. 2HG41-7]|uniref:hypothetical protein n=1 Tax=Dyella sp. 2HG41-7 TaxID=2883239 RepID=UPI001F1B73AA|nr:hypothetical protein [Dyella sp. 2HG41-7]
MQKITRATLGLFLAMGLSGVAAAAAPPTTGLGQAWPNAVDVSASPHWHVYVFVLNGIEYVQVNDLNGNVIGAVGTAGGQFITLPIGNASQYVATPQQSAAHAPSVSATSAATTVYRDSSMVLTATPQTSGITTLNAASANTAATCQDPEQCGAGSP